MHRPFSYVCALVLASMSFAAAAQHNPPQRDVRITLINMSGKAREAHVRRETIVLPATRSIALQVKPGEHIHIASNTDSKIASDVTILATDDGRTIVVP